MTKPGTVVKKNDPIVTLESDKSSVEVPSPFSGKISSLEVKIGDKVSKGSVLAIIEDIKSEIPKNLDSFLALLGGIDLIKNHIANLDKETHII